MMNKIETKQKKFDFKMNHIDDDESTVSYFDDCILEVNASTHRRRSFGVDDDDDESIVSTEPSTTLDDHSCTWNDDIFDYFGFSSHDDDDDDKNEASNRKVKRVTFGDATVREYGVTVGSCTPVNTGRCPIELTWDYADLYTIDVKKDDSTYLRRPRPLSATQRRERIARIQGISNDDVLILEYESSIALIKETLEYLESSRYKRESPSIYSESTFNSAHQEKQIVGASNKFLRKLMIEEISFNPL